MVPRHTYICNLELAWSNYHVKGCVVECGVWRGGMSAGLVAALGASRDYYLLDSFEGLPTAKEIDGVSMIEWQRNKSPATYYDNCCAPVEWAQKAMAQSGARSFDLVRGWFDKTVPELQLREPIALLRLDGDLYDSTMVCLKGLFDSVVAGGLIMIDDYYAWDGCSRAVHDFLSHRSATERIQQAGSLGYIRKLS